MSHITVIGEAIADALLPVGGRAGEVLRMEVRPGGSQANTAVALGRLGCPTSFLGRLSTGPFGLLLREHLVSSGVDVSGCVEAPEEATLAVATIDRDGQATYDFYARGTADWQWTRDELADRAPLGASCVQTGSLALAMRPGGPLIEDLLERVRPHATISVDPNVRPRLVPPDACRARLSRWTGLADILRLSEEDLAHLAPGTRVEHVCDSWHADGVRLVIVTFGADGVLASLGGTRIRVPAFAVEAVDTVGAGDAFMAGVLHWLERRGALGGRLDALGVEDVRAAVTFAVRIAAETCRVAGANPPWADLLPADARDLLPPGPPC